MPSSRPTDQEPRSGRVEDDAFLRGLGRYTGDHGQDALIGRFVRSAVAHARIAALDLTAARLLPDVVAVLAAADLAPCLPVRPRALDAITNRDGTITPVPSRPALAGDRVRFVGEAFALVVARTEAAANDAAEAVVVELDELPDSAAVDSVPDADLHEEAPGNTGFDWQGGDPEAVRLAFDRAAHLVSAQIVVPRILGAPLEPFSCLASHDATNGTWTLIAPTQGSHAVRRELADGYLGIAHERLRVVTPDVGGAFGLRIHALPEQAALLAATRIVGAPIRWPSDRTESNLCEPHARDLVVQAELALDPEGCFLGLRASALCNLGAYVHPGAWATPTASLLFGLQGPYRMPALGLHVRGIYTNTTPTGPFRGAGQPEGAYVLERLIDRAAVCIGLLPAELRRRNALAAADMPYRAASGHLVDSCEAASLLRQASDWLASRPPTGVDDLTGTGLAMYLKVNGMGRQERAEIAVDPETGTVTARIGSQSNGQGHATTFGALTAERLGIDPARVEVLQGDTTTIAFGTGTGASSALGTTGTGVSRSCADLLRQARTAAAASLDRPADELVYEAGSFHAPGANRFISLREIAAELPEGLVGRSEVGVSLTYTVGCHACRVGVDPQTGQVTILDYAAFDDLGPVLQPAIAQGQIHGGVAQGIGQALHEAVRYTPDGSQPVTATFLDYQLPRASDLPDLVTEIAETPSQTTDLGVRGAGEAGAVASMAAVVNAVAAAIGGDPDLVAPLTPFAVWRQIGVRAAG